jgi:hypothetical protein
MRDQERFALARGFLDRAATLVPDLEDLDGARAALTEAERQAEIDRTAEAAAAVIEGRKSSFAAAVEANDLEQALAMLDDLRARLPDDDEFLTETAPAALAGVYLALAQEAAGSGDLVAAEQYAREGRLVAPSNRLFEGFLSDIGAGGRTECTAVLAGRGAAPDLAGACWDMLDADVRGPVLVVIPGGEGSARPFGLGRFETSVADWNRYCGLSGECELRAGAEDDPLTNVAVADIERYASWLSERTGAAYRLPTLTEWHYAANQPHFDRNDNCRSDSMRSVLAGSTNQWGLVDYLGNVRERVSDGSRLVFRGGSYADTLCSVNLGAEDAGAPDPVTGFRLVRELAAAQ